MLIILFERLSSLLFAWIILSQLWNTQRNYVLSEKFYRLILYEYFIWIENIEASMQIDNPALHVLHVVLSQIFEFWNKNLVFLQFIISLKLTT